ncbi:SDR family NAD(P)-dependent oxidoreductase [Streptomyces sp. NPDC050147]|uniref:SDR family NAD(P)-dependent oxidoreductase n=1 Tax=Streptomyces sp. NPDC050147 TaxID=3155513 RepID=UPI003429E9ED
MDDRKPLALVTGASSGIGYELAKQFAENGYDLLLTAEDGELHLAGDEIRAYGARVEVVQIDLAEPDGVERLHAAISALGQPVAAAALNAGVGKGGPFIETELADEIRLIDLNVTSTVRLAKRLLPDMIARGEGRVLFTSSIAASMPGSFQAVYNASKSFVQSFAQALQNELKDSGLTITSFMPGPTETEFFRRAGMEDTKIGRQEKDEQDPPGQREGGRPPTDGRAGFCRRGQHRAVTRTSHELTSDVRSKLIPGRLRRTPRASLAQAAAGSKRS